MNTNNINPNTASLPSSVSTPTNDNGNELPTPPSIPLCDPPPFPTTNPPKQKNRAPPNPNNYLKATPLPHYNKYYGSYPHTIPNPMYTPYPVPHYPSYPSYPSFPRPPPPFHASNPTANRPISPYPTFNGITPKSNTTAPTYNLTQNTTPNSSKSVSNRSSPKAHTKKAPKINPTFRPFYEQIETEKKIETDTENDTETDANDSDYEPDALNDRKCKKKSKKVKKKKKQSKKRKKNQIETDDNVLYLASQMVYVTQEESLKPTKSLTWKEFRDWLKYHLESFDHQNYNKQRQRELFTMKMKKLLSFCTEISVSNSGNDELFYCLWLQIPEKRCKWIQLVISDGGWFTNCTSEEQMMGYVTSVAQKDYWFFRVLEGQRCPSNIVLLLRCDKGGNCGELVWLQKGQNVSGTDALAIENALSCALDLKWVYLHDDSKIKYGGNSCRSTCHLYLKTIRSIAKGQSWYAQALYRPFNCRNWPSQTSIDGNHQLQTGVEAGTVFTQNAQQYKRAVHLIRNYKITSLRKQLILNSGCMDASDLKKLDEVLISMNEYDPYPYEAPSRCSDGDDEVNASYFFDDDDDDGGDDDDDVPVTRRKYRSRGHHNNESIERHRKLGENSKLCTVYRWHRGRIGIKCNPDSSSCCVSSSIVEYRKQCHTIGDIAAVLYREGNPESWNKSHGLKLLRCAKENLIKFFQHILTSFDSKDMHRLTQEFKRFHCALKCIEETKIFGKRSKRWALKQKKRKHVQPQPHVQPHSYKSQSTEPLYDVVLRARPSYKSHYQWPVSLYNCNPPVPVTVPPIMYAHAHRNRLFGDAHKLKLKEISEKKKLYDHKMKLQKDLDSHLIPNRNRNRKEKHKLLFESLINNNEDDDDDDINVADTNSNTNTHTQVSFNFDFTINGDNIHHILDVFNQIKTDKLSGHKRHHLPMPMAMPMPINKRIKLDKV